MILTVIFSGHITGSSRTSVNIVTKSLDDPITWRYNTTIHGFRTVAEIEKLAIRRLIEHSGSRPNLIWARNRSSSDHPYLIRDPPTLNQHRCHLISYHHVYHPELVNYRYFFETHDVKKASSYWHSNFPPPAKCKVHFLSQFHCVASQFLVIIFWFYSFFETVPVVGRFWKEVASLISLFDIKTSPGAPVHISQNHGTKFILSEISQAL